jgi:hypothetical protein
MIGRGSVCLRSVLGVGVKSLGSDGAVLKGRRRFVSEGADVGVMVRRHKRRDNRSSLLLCRYTASSLESYVL